MEKIELKLTLLQADLLMRALQQQVTGLEDDMLCETSNQDFTGSVNAVRGADRKRCRQDIKRSYSLQKQINKRASKIFGQNW